VTVLLYVVIPKDLFPVQSTGQLQGQVQAASDVSFERMSALQGDAAPGAAGPAVLSLSSVVGWMRPTTAGCPRAAW
jgi:multidrug efflux pump